MPAENKYTSNVKEPSTWIGFIAVLVGAFFGATNPEVNDPTFWGSVTTVVSGLWNIFTRTKK